MNQLADLRIELAEARITLRQAKDTYEIMRAVAETDAVENHGVNGKNAEERTRNMTVALLSHEGYNGSLRYLRECEAAVDRLTAQIAGEEDQISQHRLAERERNDRAIERLAMALEKIGGAPAAILSRLEDIPF